jgi:Predicted nucleotide-binding protein containing TIR-like domain
VENTKRFRGVRFDSKTFFAVHKMFESLASSKTRYVSLVVEAGGEVWHYDTLQEFLAAVDKGWATFHVAADKDLSVIVIPADGTMSVSTRAPTREEIEQIASIFERESERCRLPIPPPPAAPAVKVFIGHGGDPQWKDLKDHLHEKHGYLVEAYEIGSRAGHAIRDILEEMLEASSFALLVMTGEDETKDGKLLARQNVVHEAGLFQGHLGFGRAVILLEDGTEEFSNIAGLQQIRFSKGNIKETFGDVLAVLKRELG